MMPVPPNALRRWGALVLAHRVALVALCAGLVFSPAVTAQEGSGSASELDPFAAPTEPEPAAAQAEEPEAPADVASGNEGRLPCEGTPPQIQACESYNEALADYEREIRGYQSTMGEIVRIEYQQRRNTITDYYSREIDTRREEERLRRIDAIADFERFLQRYPNHPEYTPDVMFRLAELYYERSEADYAIAEVEFDRAYARWEMGIDPTEPASPTKDFGPTIGLFEQLLQRFPDYRQIDGVYYLLAVSYEAMFESRQAQRYFAQLVREYPESDFAQETYLRIGEYHFERAEFELALSAYQASVRYGESRWYDKILFKLGWSTYLLGRFDEGIEYFEQLLAYYDETGAEEADGVRPEAILYIAISIAENDWDLDGETDPEYVMPRILEYLGNDEPYAGEVLDAIVNLLVEGRQFDFALEVLEYTLGLDPCAPENLDRTLLMITAYEQLRQFDVALTAQRNLGSEFGPGTEWYQCQEREGNLTAMAQAEQVAKESLMDSAARYYLRAQETASRASFTVDANERIVLEQAAVEEYAYAARIYGEFLEQYGNEPEAYEMRMYYAQTLLFSQQYALAASAFSEVRDSEQSDQFRELAAALAIQSYEYELEREIDAYRLEGRAWPAYDGDNQWEPVEADASTADEPRGAPVDEPIPELSLAWAAAIDRYIDLDLNAEDDPATRGRFAFQAGKLFYDYKHYADARDRFVAILEECRPQQETGFAAGFLLETYRATGDTEGFLEVSELMQTRYDRCISDDLRELIASDVNRIGMGMMAQRAEELFAEGRFEEAAQEYVRLANEYAENADTAPLGLFNAGLIYEQQLKKFELAMRQFDRIITEYGGSEYVDDALVRIAVNSKRFFDFDRAISTYLVLDDMGWEDPEGVFAPPIVDAAELLRASGRFEEAAVAYLEYVDDFPNDARAPALLYQTGVMYDEIEDHRSMRDTFARFRSDYGDGYSELIDIDAAVIDTISRSIDAYVQAGDARAAERERNNLLSEFAVRLPSDDRSKYAAARVIYDRVYGDYEEWDEIELGETVQEQQRGLASRIERIEPLLIDFNTVIDDYGSADWTVCALYMQGRIFQRMADLLYGLPVPDFRGNIDAEDEYILMIEDIATQYEDQAIAQWEIGYPIMQQLGVTNQCTIDMTAQLNRYRGADYPVFRDAIEVEQFELFTPQRFGTVPEAPEVEEVLQLDSADIDPFGTEAP
jgi:cellulose synthase operon protein C